ncbi:MULE domain-containing protein [Aphis craccivora]|uniref:MULE domain-containing protein n=1 Tax=Aphis craccivora TaxID=307492 RepID=A0A6G0VS00_APHCR|nr:MULE domain-containing protein [Aphis craccivora]
MRQVRRKNLPPNPKTLFDLGTLPDQYQKTLTGEKFLIYDSLDDNSVSEGRVVVFSTRRNLELLAKNDCWFLDGIFKVYPNIFKQVFTILGTCKQHVDVHDTVAVPFVYALLSSKETVQYATVLRAVQSSFNEHIIFCEPLKIMPDFEKSMPVKKFFQIRLSFAGLQAAYNDPDDRSLKYFTHMMLALAFVPLTEVSRIFSLLKNDALKALSPIIEYFEKNYVLEVIGRGRRRGIHPRYPPEIWNQYQTALTGSHKTKT